ncbi:MAG: dihydroorotate dehydrogenase [Kordiimonadaceae bacterium]|nr:dihydroorotate dehydrogenase [Kordiimonadaceae bacterium]MBT6037105.1 dihydroorotate dehydrogenase [Kordiimonadaceae bacterium]MBT6329287.1 dihydroorotate dehydrogenase [Kordiimonadaceae bacterium]
MKSLGVNIGNITLKNPLICGSGEHFIELSGIEKALKAGAGAVVIKSTNESDAAKEQLEKTDYALLDSNFNKLEWDFNPPRDASVFNRSGLHPQPFDQWLELAAAADKLAAEHDAYAVASLIPASTQKLLEYAREIEKAGIRILEVNVGAPHGEEAATGAIMLEREASRISDITKALRKAVDIPLWIKLTGQSQEIPAMVKAAKDAGADAVTLMGRYMGFIPDIDTGKPMLGTHAAYGGPWALPLTCHWLVKTRAQIGSDYSLMATNGARNGHDIIRFMLSGASAVQMTSAIFASGYDIISNSINELTDYLNVKDLDCIALIGAAADQCETYADQQNRKDYWRDFTPT